MNKAPAFIEVMLYDYKRLDKPLREIAFAHCHRDKGKCWKKKECQNEAIVAYLWQCLAERN